MSDTVYPVFASATFQVDVDADGLGGAIRTGDGDPFFQDYVTIASNGSEVTITPTYEGGNDTFTIASDGSVSKSCLFGRGKHSLFNPKAVRAGLVTILEAAQKQAPDVPADPYARLVRDFPIPDRVYEPDPSTLAGKLAQTVRQLKR